MLNTVVEGGTTDSQRSMDQVGAVSDGGALADEQHLQRMSSVTYDYVYDLYVHLWIQA